MTKILQGMPGTAHELIDTLAGVLLKYEPRLQSHNVTLLEQQVPCLIPDAERQKCARHGDPPGMAFHLKGPVSLPAYAQFAPGAPGIHPTVRGISESVRSWGGWAGAA